MTLALSLFGLYVSLYLLYAYTSPSRPMVCIGTGCDAVRASAYSSVGGVPMPIFGVFGYLLLSFVVIAESLFAARAARLARRAFVVLSGFGFLVSLYLEYLQAFVIRAYCAWCLASGVVMTALLALAIFGLVRSGPEPDPRTQLKQARSMFSVCVAGVMAGAPVFYLLARHGELPAEPSQAAPTALASRLIRPDSHETGNPQAPLTVVEFGDFECPVCGRGEAAAREVRAKYAGQVRFVFRQFPLERIHPLAPKAAEASECAGEQGRFWEMLEKIYSRQDDLSIEGLGRNAAELGLDQPRFQQCLLSGAMAGRVRRDVEDGRALGVRATPTFFIGHEKVEGVLTAAQFSQRIDGRLAGVGMAASEIEPIPPPAVVDRRVAAKAAVPWNPLKVPATNRPAPSGAGPSGADSESPLIGVPPAAPGGLTGGWRPPAPAGLFGSAPGGATCSEADAAKLQPTLIDTAALRALLAGNARPLFVDVRPAGDYATGHMPGAIHLPADVIGHRWNTLPKDRTIVLYESGRSSGDVCAAGRAVGRTLLEHGFPFSQIKVYQDGLAGWERAGMGTEQ